MRQDAEGCVALKAGVARGLLEHRLIEKAFDPETGHHLKGREAWTMIYCITRAGRDVLSLWEAMQPVAKENGQTTNKSVDE
ncbi:hypothetical protein [Paracoccus sp. MKU1]|uniref:hypothetical protein n=1 Tax=Paracoccus sp. MKU1 TaxID=1745182 RepID=UPI0007190F95|nr:hypothetical protein [Paracoccus sp. MKU1]KRW94307.1 hypothetical protein AQY21_20475 [Paracoccus sp. MKU1]